MTSRASTLLTALALGLAGFLAGCQGRLGPPPAAPTQRVGVWNVAVSNQPDPPRVGDNLLSVMVRDSTGRPMLGTVGILVSMPAMGSMPRMESKATVASAGKGTFRGSYGLAMGGEWDVTLRIVPASGAPVEARYRLSTSIPGLAFAGGTPPSGAENAFATTTDADSSGAVMIDPARRQALGIRTEPVQVRALSTTLRVPGRLDYDESRRAEVSLKFGGWVRSLAASVTGQPIREGQVLFEAYSPELWSAQQEYLEALEAARGDRGTSSMAGPSADLAEAARVRLALWDVAPRDIDAIARAGKPLEAVPIRSPASGVVTEKNVVLGSGFQPGQVLFRIARLDPIWVIASVSQQDMGLVRAGMSAIVRDARGDAGAQRGRVAFVYPSLDNATRSAEIRITTRNPGGRFQVGTYVEVELLTPPLNRLAVPESAVLPTGERHVVFVALGDGRLAPREVRLGLKAGGYYEVQSGLTAGELVVSSGNFLVAAESKLRSAAQKW